jgi:hypothetical protein
MQIKEFSIITFSKDRPLQIQAYLESLLYFSEIDQSRITVLYKETPEINYNKIIKQFSQVCWIKEEFFYTDLLKIINQSCEFIMFGCDDVVFKDHIDFPNAINILKSNDQIFGFSTRLGENILPLPSFLRKFNKHLEWDWQNADTNHWNYPWELDATIYRKSDILNIVSMLNPRIITNPNFLEGEVAIHPEYINKKLLASFSKSKCIVLTINRVQDDFLNEFDNTFSSDTQTLYKLYMHGTKIDFITISKKENDHIHVGTEFFKLSGNKHYFLFNNYLKRPFRKISSLVKRILHKVNIAN